MGSSGSGKFGTYHIGNGESGIAGTSEKSEIECPKIIENIRLEDVATSEYYVKHNNLPAIHTKVQIRNKIYLGRLVVETIDTHELIGNLPTQYNYLINCINSGLYYTGNVISSGKLPIPFVVVTLNA